MNNNINFKIPKDKSECDYIGLNFKEETPSFVFPCQYFPDSNISDKEKKAISFGLK